MFYMNKPFLLMTSMTMIISSIMALSSTNWIFLWMSMEINMLSFIPLMTNSKTNQETEASIKYFMAQALGSSIMLMTSLTQWSTASIQQLNILLIAAILLKLGMAPMHFWFPPVMTSLSWMSCMVLATWQKLAPLTILSFFIQMNTNSFILIISSINALLGGMMGMNQSHLRTIMAYSSITHMGWMTCMLYTSNPSMTMSYYIMYCSITIPLFIMLNLLNQTDNKQFNKLNSMSPLMQLMLPLMLLSLSGMPPLTGFIPKWLTIYSMCETTPITLIILILGAMMNAYFYMNILFNSLLSMSMNNQSSTQTALAPKIPTIIATTSLSMLPIMMM